MEYFDPASISSHGNQSSVVTDVATVTLRQLAEISEVSEDDLLALARYGVLVPVDSFAPNVTFSHTYIAVAKRALRLRNELTLDEREFVLSAALIQKMVGLEADVASLRMQLRRKQLSCR